MVVTVQGRLVSALMDLADQSRVAFGGFAHQVERGAYPMPFKHIQQARCVAWMGTIVKGQCDLTTRPIALKKDLRKPALGRTIEAQEGRGEDSHALNDTRLNEKQGNPADIERRVVMNL